MSRGILRHERGVRENEGHVSSLWLVWETTCQRCSIPCNKAATGRVDINNKMLRTGKLWGLQASGPPSSANCL